MSRSRLLSAGSTLLLLRKLLPLRVGQLHVLAQK
jgi:hypothetical protein